uniref:5'-AMP-activated protein kinase subunit gamma-1 n=1 Tax=Rodentolepis nana TaxID=102285 RepID=A0A0R3U0W5_RODNA
LEVDVFEALQYRRQKFSGVSTCMLHSTLKEIIDIIVDAEVHRLVVVDEAQHVLGIVSLSDILRFLIQKHPMSE